MLQADATTPVLNLRSRTKAAMFDDTTPIHPLYVAFDPDDPDLDNVTLCLDCAKHPSLKRFIQAHAVEGPVCGICQEVGYVYPACDPQRTDDLVNVIKALLRFYYNEHEYNGHWGAEDEPEELLVKPNPILEDRSRPGRARVPERSSEFLYSLLSAVPYPRRTAGSPCMPDTMKTASAISSSP